MEMLACGWGQFRINDDVVVLNAVRIAFLSVTPVDLSLDSSIDSSMEQLPELQSS